MKTYKTIFCEFQCVGFEHTPVNSAMIMSFSIAYPNDNFLFLAESEHLTIVKNILEKQEVDNVDYLSINIPERNSTPLQRIYEDYKLINMSNFKNSKSIVFLSVNTTLLLWLKVKIKSFKNMKFFVIVHSILESLITKPSKKPWYRILNFKNIFYYLNQINIRYILLSPSIKIELQKIRSDMDKYCISIHHPYIFDITKILNNNIHDENITFGFIGVAHKNKGFDVFLNLEKSISSSKYSKKVIFQCIGKLIDKTIDLTNSNVQILFNDYIERAEFDKACELITYAIFPYRQDTYRLYPSGAFFDALLHEKPVICLRNPFFEYYFNLLGDIGYLCEDYTQMELEICKISEEFTKERYEKQISNLRNGKQFFEPKAIKNLLLNNLEDFIK